MNMQFSRINKFTEKRDEGTPSRYLQAPKNSSFHEAVVPSGGSLDSVLEAAKEFWGKYILRWLIRTPRSFSGG